MADQPRWNPADKDSGCTLSAGDRTAVQVASNAGSVRSTAPLSSGKWYVELDFGGSASISTDRHRCGVANGSASISGAAGDDANAWVIQGNGQKRTNNGAAAYGNQIDNPLRIAIDLDNGKIWFGEGTTTWFASGDPAAGTGEAFSGLSGPLYLIFGGSNTTGNKIGTLLDVASYGGTPPAGFTAGWGVSATTYNQSLTASSTVTAAIRKTTNKFQTATSTVTGSIRRTVSKFVTVTSTVSAVVFKTVSKALTVTSAVTATLAKIALRPVVMVATSTASALMQRTTSKFATATSTVDAAIQKVVGKTLAATSTVTATLIKAFGLTLAATSAASASISRTTHKFLSATSTTTAALSRLVAFGVTLTATSTVTATLATIRLFTMVMTATSAVTASMTRTVSITLTATISAFAKPIQWVASMYAAIRGDKPNWNQCARCLKSVRPNKLRQQMEWRGERLVPTGLYVCAACEDQPQPQNITPRHIGGDPRPVPNARPRRD